MKKLAISLLVLLTVIAVSGCGGGGGSKSPVAETCTLKVEGFMDIDQNPLEGVTVKVIGESKTYEGKSDASGKVTISSIPVGTYMVRYSLDGKVTLYDRLTLKAGSNTVKTKYLVTWADYKSGYMASFVDETKFNIKGTVYDVDGKTPLAGATVSVSPDPDQLGYLDGSTNPLTISYTATKTDESGTFFVRLSTGKYTFTVSDGTHTFDPVEINVTEPGMMLGLSINAK